MPYWKVKCDDCGHEDYYEVPTGWSQDDALAIAGSDGGWSIRDDPGMYYCPECKGRHGYD